MMSTNDFMVKSLFAIFVMVILCGMALCIIRECNRTKVYANPKQVIRKERIGETSESEIWRTSIYSLDKVSYDTIPKKTSWDTAHELPR